MSDATPLAVPGRALYRGSVNGSRRSLSSLTTVAAVAIVLCGCVALPQPVETRLPPAAPDATPTAASPATPFPAASPSPFVSPSASASSSATVGDVIACGDGPVALNGEESTVRLEGTCDSVTVSGSAFTVDATAATIRTLDIQGDRIRLDAAAADTITLQGNDGVVSVAQSVTSVTLRGDRSTVSSTGDIAAVEIQGQDNTIRADGSVQNVTLEGRGNTVS